MPNTTATSKQDDAPEPSKKPTVFLTGKGGPYFYPDPDQVTGEAMLRAAKRANQILAARRKQAESEVATPSQKRRTPRQNEKTPKQAPDMMKKLIGRWRLTEMSNWDNQFMDEESPAFIAFEPGRSGEFHFGYVHCTIDWRPEKRQGGPGAAFTFMGNDEMDETRGRGWAEVQADGTLKGHLYFHQGDDSTFCAKRHRS